LTKQQTRLFLGVDGGQSATVAVIGDEHGRILGTGSGGPCNHVSTSEARERFMSAIGAAVRAALQAASASPGESGAVMETTFDAACFGLSGGPADKEALAREIVRAKRYRITHDAAIALTGATGAEPGVIVIAGTGSIAFGKNAGGETARAGGWGYIFGDEGSAFDLVRRALRAVLRSEEGWGPSTALREALLEAGGATDANSLLHRFYTPEFPRDRIASFAKCVDQTAEYGDTVAVELLSGAAQSLAALAASVRRRLFHNDASVTVSYAGGVFRSRMLLERFKMLVELDGTSAAVPPRDSPAAGALIEACRLGGVNVMRVGEGELLGSASKHAT
jgi:N-acetylglucosamine kinase-like BadF-type ATPase